MARRARSNPSARKTWTWRLQPYLPGVSLLSARALSREPRPEVRILGVEPQSIDYGIDLTEPAARLLPRLVEEVRRVARAWSQEPVDLGARRNRRLRAHPGYRETGGGIGKAESRLQALPFR